MALVHTALKRAPADLPTFDEILERRQQVDAWAPVQQAYQRSVSEILSFERDPRVADWLAESTRQFINQAKHIQKLAPALALIDKLTPRVQKGAGVVTIKKREGEPMTAWDTIQKIAAESGRTVDAVCQSEGELYQRYLKEEQAGTYLPTLQKRAEAPIPSGATATLIMLAEAKIAKGMKRIDAYAEVARECAEQYKAYRLQSLGRTE